MHTHTHTHTHTIAHSPVGLDVWPGALRTGAYTVCLPIWAQQAVLGGGMCISFSQTINVLWKSQYKPQSLKSPLKKSLCQTALVKRSREIYPDSQSKKSKNSQWKTTLFWYRWVICNADNVHFLNLFLLTEVKKTEKCSLTVGCQKWENISLWLWQRDKELSGTSGAD